MTRPFTISSITIYILLQMDGVYHIWQQGEGLNGVSEFYVIPDAIIDYSATS